MKLEGANIAIIGGSSGMGLAVAQMAKSQNAHVTIVSRSKEKLKLAAQQLDDVRTIAADMTSEADMRSVFQGFDRIDHIFISAGQMFPGKVVETDIAILRSDVEQRFWGPVYVIRNAIPKMTQGSITFLTGQYGSKPDIEVVVTAAMNAAVEVLAKGLALELAPIRVNAVAPGLIDTPLISQFREDAEKWAKSSLPVRRMGTVEEVAEAVILLMSNGFITGEVLHIDGGGRLI